VCTAKVCRQGVGRKSKKPGPWSSKERREGDNRGRGGKHQREVRREAIIVYSFGAMEDNSVVPPQILGKDQIPTQGENEKMFSVAQNVPTHFEDGHSPKFLDYSRRYDGGTGPFRYKPPRIRRRILRKNNSKKDYFFLGAFQSTFLN